MSNPSIPADVEVLAAESMLEGTPVTALSPIQSAALAAVENAWIDAAKLAGMVKNFARAGTAAKALCGIRLRALREQYFGPRNPGGGRPNKNSRNLEFSTWPAMVLERVGITDETARVWMKLADAVESIADHQGLDLRATLEKLPWDWTPEEAARIDAAVHKLTGDKTQRQLLQSDFLSDLGYTEPERINGSNNPLGINGGKKKAPANAQERLEGLRCLARTGLFGHDSTDHRPKPGSPAYWMNALVERQGRIAKDAHPMASLSKQERKEIYELLIKPFVDAYKALDS